MGFPKALARYEGESFVSRLVRLQREAGCCTSCVVVGSPHGEVIASELSGAGVELAVNPSPELGMLSSLQCGISAVMQGPALAALVCLVDQPLVLATTLQRLLAARAAREADWVYPVFEGRRGHPYVIGRALFATALELGATATARDLLAQARSSEAVEVDDHGVRLDLDRPGDLARAGAIPPAVALRRI